MIATLHFISRRQRKVYGSTPSKHSVIDEFKAIKKDKFPDPEINAWYEALVGVGLIDA